MEKIKFYKEKFLCYINEQNIVVSNEVLSSFDAEILEDVYENLKTFDNESLTYIKEIICEDLIVNGVAKIERSGMKLGLHRMESILSLLGNPEKKLNVIHVAGTNGKGSVSSYLRTTLSSKYRVGMYSSPAMISFNDRIRINDDFITYEKMYELYSLVLATWYENFPSSDDNLSFFEVLTVAGLLYFAEENVDFVIMEVGLGGRYDGTNVFSDKLLSIITKIGLDHTNMLGDTIEKIAYEKAGIVAQNDNVLIYPASENVVSVIKNIANEKNAKLEILNTNKITIKNIGAKSSEFSFGEFENIKIKMLGEHQIYNASLALTALNNLRTRGIINLTNEEIKSGIEKTTWAGRLEWITDNILLDGAHNIDGVTSLVNYIKKQNLGKTKLLVAILEDKDYQEMIDLFETLDADFFITKVPIDIKESKLENLQSSFSKSVTAFENYDVALDSLLSNLNEDETLIISGSLYLISAVRNKILKIMNR